VAEKETPRERMMREELELDKKSMYGVSDIADKLSTKIKDRLRGDNGFGTSRSPGARSAGYKKAEEIFNKEDKTAGEALFDPRARQAMREAAAEERREAGRGMKKGGMTASSRADGIAQRGKTRGKMV